MFLRLFLPTCPSSKQKHPLAIACVPEVTTASRSELGGTRRHSLARMRSDLRYCTQPRLYECCEEVRRGHGWSCADRCGVPHPSSWTWRGKMGVAWPKWSCFWQATLWFQRALINITVLCQDGVEVAALRSGLAHYMACFEARPYVPHFHWRATLHALPMHPSTQAQINRSKTWTRRKKNAYEEQLKLSKEV